MILLARSICDLPIARVKMRMKNLLVVSNMPSDNTARLAKAVVRGARHEDIENVQVVHKAPLDANASDVLNAHGIVIGTTENFGYMSGLVKDFFERIFYECLEHTEALPYALYIRAGNDGTGTRIAVEKIITGLKWKAVQAPLILQGEYTESFEQKCEELGTTMSAGLDNGIF